MTMAHAMVMEKFKVPLVEREFPLGRLAAGQALVKIAAAGVCGSDVHMWEGKDTRVPLPIILGHEGIGYLVERTGRLPDVYGEDLVPGDLVFWNRGVSCGRCFYCSIARTPSLCPDRWVYGIHRGIDVSPHLNGCYSEYIILEPGTDLFKVKKAREVGGGVGLQDESVDDPIDPAVLVAASCSGATAAHAFELACLEPGSSVVVQGPGPVGIFAVAFARDLGASEVIAIGGTEARLGLCRRMGATRVIDRRAAPEESRRELIMDLTGGRGADLVVETVGSPAAVAEGIKLVRPGGTYLLVGFGVPAGSVQIDPFHDLVRKNVRLQGVWVSDARHAGQALDLVLRRYEDFTALVTHRFKLSEANEALRAMAGKEVVKAVLVP